MDSQEAPQPSPDGTPPARENGAEGGQETFTWELLAVLSLACFPLLWHGMIRLLDFPPGWSYTGWPFALYAVHRALLDGFLSVVLLYILHRSGESWSHFGFARPQLLDVGYGLGLCLVQLFVWIIWSQATYHAYSVGFGEQKLDIPEPRDRLDYFLVVPMNFSVALFEETAFRGYLIARFRSMWKYPLEPIALSAALFGLLHTHRSLFGMLEVAVVTGLVYGAFYYWTQRIWPCILAHFAWNAMIYWRVI